MNPAVSSSSRRMRALRRIGARIQSFFYRLFECVMRSGFEGLSFVIVKPLARVSILLILSGLRWTELILKFLLYWWYRLPDRREVEHRQIAASQYVESLDELLPYERGGALWTEPRVSPTAQEGSKVEDAERYLDEYFKQVNSHRPLISGLMGIRSLNVVPEHLVDYAEMLAKSNNNKNNPFSVRSILESDSNSATTANARFFNPLAYSSSSSQLDNQLKDVPSVNNKKLFAEFSISGENELGEGEQAGECLQLLY